MVWLSIRLSRNRVAASSYLLSAIKVVLHEVIHQTMALGLPSARPLKGSQARHEIAVVREHNPERPSVVVRAGGRRCCAELCSCCGEKFCALLIPAAEFTEPLQRFASAHDRITPAPRHGPLPGRPNVVDLGAQFSGGGGLPRALQHRLALDQQAGGGRPAPV